MVIDSNKFSGKFEICSEEDFCVVFQNNRSFQKPDDESMMNPGRSCQSPIKKR